jgi:hypothetical protein
MPFPWKHNFHVCTQVAALYSHRLTDTGVTLYDFSEKGGKKYERNDFAEFQLAVFILGGGGGLSCALVAAVVAHW